MKQSTKFPLIVLIAILSVNLLLGFQAYSEGVHRDDDVESVRVFVDAVGILRKNYVDADKVHYRRLVYAALKGMVKELDQHSRFHTPLENKSVKEENDGRFAGIGVILNFEDKKLTVKKIIPNGPASKSVLKVNDTIVAVDGHRLKGEGFAEAKGHIKGLRGTTVIITVLRKGSDRELEVPVVRDIIKVPSVTRVRVIPDSKLGYMYVAQFSRETAVDFRNSLTKLIDKNIEGLIIDLRGNTGGILEAVIQMCSYFLNKNDLIIYTQGRAETHQKKYFAHGGVKFANLPIVILIDGGSASAAEILSACLHDYGKAVLVGEKSYGKGSVQTIADLRDGSALRFTIAKYYTKSGVTIHNVGIAPDVEVKLNAEEKRKVQEVLQELYISEEEFALYDADDRQLKTAVAVLQNLVSASSDQEVLEVFSEQRAEILKNINEFIELTDEESLKENPSSGQ